MGYEYYLYLALSVGNAYGYGWGEKMCGDIGHPRACSKGAVTASGEIFDPEIPSIAVSAPSKVRGRAYNIYIKVKNGPCIKVRANDKKNFRYLRTVPIDISPRAIQLMTGSRSRNFSDKIYLCRKDFYEEIVDVTGTSFQPEHLRRNMR